MKVLEIKNNAKPDIILEKKDGYIEIKVIENKQQINFENFYIKTKNPKISAFSNNHNINGKQLQELDNEESFIILNIQDMDDEKSSFDEILIKQNKKEIILKAFTKDNNKIYEKINI